MRTLVWDTETSLILGGFWGLYDQNIPYMHVTQDWFMLSSAWKWLGEDKVHIVSILDDMPRFKRNHADDRHVIKTMHVVLSEADVVIAHNLKKFDWPKFMARVIYHNLPPLDRPQFIDTLTAARKFRFTSNRLDDLCSLLSLERKMVLTPGLWIAATQGDKKAIRKIAEYNGADIPPLEELYLLLRPYMETHPNHGAYCDGVVCPRCGSSKLKKDGTTVSGLSVYQRYKCGSCKKSSRGGKSLRRAHLRNV